MENPLMALKDSGEHVFTLSVGVSALADHPQAFVTIYGGNRLPLDGTLHEIAVQALAEYPLTKEESFSRGTVWRPIDPEEDGDSVTIAFLRIKSR